MLFSFLSSWGKTPLMNTDWLLITHGANASGLTAITPSIAAMWFAAATGTMPVNGVFPSLL